MFPPSLNFHPNDDLSNYLKILAKQLSKKLQGKKEKKKKKNYSNRTRTTMYTLFPICFHRPSVFTIR